MFDEKRFEKIHTEARLGISTEIWRDMQTGVNYLVHRTSNSMGLTPLLNENGKPIVTH